jgi:hypothetical protein
MKSHAVFSDGAGMPGVSAEAKGSGDPILGGDAKLPGEVPCAVLEGFPPSARGLQQSADEVGYGVEFAPARDGVDVRVSLTRSF